MSTVLEPVVEPRVIEVVPSETQQILVRAADIVKTGWCRDSYAQNEWGYEVDPCDETARSFCMWGAFHRAWFEFRGEEWENRGEPHNRELGDKLTKLGFDADWNDNVATSAEEVSERIREIAFRL